MSAAQQLHSILLKLFIGWLQDGLHKCWFTSAFGSYATHPEKYFNALCAAFRLLQTGPSDHRILLVPQCVRAHTSSLLCPCPALHVSLHTLCHTRQQPFPTTHYLSTLGPAKNLIDAVHAATDRAYSIIPGAEDLVLTEVNDSGARQPQLALFDGQRYNVRKRTSCRGPVAGFVFLCV